MDISGASTFSAQWSLSFDWLHHSKLPAQLLTRCLRLVLGLAILSMARAVLALLQQSDRLGAVCDLQQRLRMAQGHDGAGNGHWAAYTQTPAALYRQRYGVAVDGVVAPQMISVLDSKFTAVQPRLAVGYTASCQGTRVAVDSTGCRSAAPALQSGRFVVIIPQRRGLQLAIVKQLVPDAIEGQFRMGRYIQAGTFASQSAAAQQSRFLQAYGFDAQVAYC